MLDAMLAALDVMMPDAMIFDDLKKTQENTAGGE